MSKRKNEEKHLNAKQRAYEKKQEAEGRKVVNWIFGVLILLAILFVVYSVFIVSLWLTPFTSLINERTGN